MRRGSTLYAFARPRLSEFGRRAAELIGPAFGALRLFAPEQQAGERVTFPSRETVWWHKVRETEGARHRWTGGEQVMWRARWPELALLQVRIPFLAEGRPGLAAGCRLRLGEVALPVRLDRGELMAEFAVQGAGEGLITLHLPAADEPPRDGEDAGAAEHEGLAVLTRSPAQDAL